MGYGVQDFAGIRLMGNLEKSMCCKRDEMCDAVER